MTSVSEKYFHLKQSVFHISFVRDFFFCLFSKKAEGGCVIQHSKLGTEPTQQPCFSSVSSPNDSVANINI